MREIPEPRMDADDQEKEAQEQFMGVERLMSVLEKAKLNAELAATFKPTPKWEKSPSEIATDIVGDRLPPNGILPIGDVAHAKMRQRIIEAIEAEREVALHYMTQMGRWWARLGK